MSTLLEERPATRDPQVTVRLVTEEGRRGGGGGGGRSLGGILHTAGLGAIAVAILLVVGAVTGLVDLGGIFDGSTKTTTSKVLLKELKNLSAYNAAEGTFSEIVTQDENVPVVPDFIAAEDVTLQVVGSVPATVDFSVLSTDAVQVSEDGTAVTITLPRVDLGPATLDLDATKVLNRSRGLINRIGDVFGENPTDDRELLTKGAAQIDKAAKESKLAARAEENTVKMLEGFLARLGFTDVTITFEEPVPAAKNASTQKSAG
jgi:hypothetical protein